MIASNGSGTNGHIFGDHCIADKGVMVDTTAGTNFGVLDFDVVSDLHAIAYRARGSNSAVRSNDAVRSDARVLDKRERIDPRVVANTRVPENAVGADSHAVPQRDRAFHDHVDL